MLTNSHSLREVSRDVYSIYSSRLGICLPFLIRQHALEHAVSQLIELTRKYSSRFHNEAIGHSASLQQILEADRKGIVSADDVRREKRRIANALTDLIDHVNEELEMSGKTKGTYMIDKKANRSDILLVAVTKVEVSAVLDEAKRVSGDDYQTHYIGNKTYYDLGEIGSARTFMVRSEMGSGGSGGSSLTVAESIDTLSPSAIVMVGIGFGVNPDKQNIGDILVSKQLMSYDLQRVGTGPNNELEIIPRGDRPSASSRLLDRFRDGELTWNHAKIQFGLVLSGPKLVDNLDFRNQLQKLEPEAIGGEMEGSGLYDASYLKKVDWILIKAICDWADGKKGQNKTQRQQQAAQNAAQFVLHVIKKGGIS